MYIYAYVHLHITYVDRYIRPPGAREWGSAPKGGRQY